MRAFAKWEICRKSGQTYFFHSPRSTFKTFSPSLAQTRKTWGCVRERGDALASDEEMDAKGWGGGCYEGTRGADAESRHPGPREGRRRTPRAAPPARRFFIPLHPSKGGKEKFVRVVTLNSEWGSGDYVELSPFTKLQRGFTKNAIDCFAWFWGLDFPWRVTRYSNVLTKT